MGVQLVGGAEEDDRLLRTANWMLKHLAGRERVGQKHDCTRDKIVYRRHWYIASDDFCFWPCRKHQFRLCRILGRVTVLGDCLTIIMLMISMMKPFLR